MLRLILFNILIFLNQILFSQSFLRIDSLNVKNSLLNVPLKNTLKMYGVAVDTLRREAYINSLQTNNISIINLDSVRETRGIDNPFGYRLVNLFVLQRNGNLLVTNSSDTPITNMISAKTGSLIGSYTHTSGSSGNFATDDRYRKFYLVDGRKVYSFSDSTFNKIDSVIFPIRIGSIQIIKEINKLLAISRESSSGYLFLFDVNLTSHSITRVDSIFSPVPLGHLEIDYPKNLLYLFGTQRVLKLNLTTKEIISSYTFPNQIQKFVYNYKNENILALSKEYYSEHGLSGDWGKLYRYSFTLNRLDSVKIGLYPQNMSFDPVKQLLVIPNMHSGYVDLLRLIEFPRRDSVDVAVSLDFIAPSPDRQNIYFAQRLGGSSILKYNRNTKNLLEFRSGPWPAVVIVDSSLNRLFSLNQYGGNISAINLSDNSLIGNINFISITEPRTDAIGTMVMNKSTKRLYAVFPEKTKLLVGDGESLSVIGEYDIPGYSYKGGKAIGVIQLAVAPSENRLFVVINDESRKVQVFNTLTNSWIDTIKLSPWPNLSTNLLGNMVFYDSISNKIWVGNWIINPTSPYTTKQILPGNFSFVGYNSDKTKIFTMNFRNDSVYINTLRNDTTYLPLRTEFLFRAGTSAAPVFYYDQLNCELLITEFNYGIFRAYKLDTLATSINLDTNIIMPSLSDFHIYPNPFNSSTKIEIDLHKSSYLKLEIYDVLGRLLKTLLDDVLSAGKHFISVNSEEIASGVYFTRLTINNQIIYTKKMIVLR